MKRTPGKYTSGEEVANAVTHVVGSHLGAAMLALLVWQGATSDVDVAWKTTSASIFGFSMILLYAVSSAYHTVTYQPAKRVLHVMDHMAIYRGFIVDVEDEEAVKHARAKFNEKAFAI